MKDKCCITLEYHFILNIVLSSLPHFESKVIVTVDPHYLCSWIELGQVNLSTSIMLGDDVENLEYLMTLPIENFRLFCCIANSLEDGCLSRIGAANDKDTKTRGDPSKVLCSFLLSLYILCSLEAGIEKRHLSLGWWK